MFRRAYMVYPFENLKISDKIQTYTVFNVEKMPDIFLEVEFTYPRCRPFNTCVPIYEKYQGIDFTKSKKEDVIDWVEECYEQMSPSNANAWNSSEIKYWENRKAEQAKPLFDVLNSEDKYHLTEWLCRQCTDISRVNSQAASRIRALKQTHGYHIATKKCFCDICGKETPHDMLLRIGKQKSGAKDKKPMPNTLKSRIKRLFAYTDACFNNKYPESSSAFIIDHKFPATRWAAGEDPNYVSMTDDEIREKFQLLTNQTNLQKDRYCDRCFQEGIRGDFFGIKWYPEGDDKWRGANASDENGCKGCPWYDLALWKKQFNEFLKTKNTKK